MTYCQRGRGEAYIQATLESDHYSEEAVEVGGKVKGRPG